LPAVETPGAAGEGEAAVEEGAWRLEGCELAPALGGVARLGVPPAGVGWDGDPPADDAGLGCDGDPPADDTGFDTVGLPAVDEIGVELGEGSGVEDGGIRGVSDDDGVLDVDGARVVEEDGVVEEEREEADVLGGVAEVGTVVDAGGGLGVVALGTDGLGGGGEGVTLVAMK